jgi:hypothetical protein
VTAFKGERRISHRTISNPPHLSVALRRMTHETRPYFVIAQSSLSSNAASRTAYGCPTIASTSWRRIDEPTKPTKPEAIAAEETSSAVVQYISQSVLRDFSMTFGEILQQWNLPGATDVYFDERTRDVVIGGRPRGSRGAGL